MATMMNNLRNLIPVNLVPDSDRLAVAEDNVLYIHMLRSKLESDLSDMDMDFEETKFVRTGRKLSRKQRRSARRVQNARHKQADRKHGKGVFSYEYKENGVIKTQILPNNMRSKSAWSKALHEWGDPDGLKGRIPRTQSVNIHFTDGATLDTINMSEADVAQTWSVSSYDLPMGDFFQYMDNMDWKRIPSEVRFSVDWNTENPFTCGYPEPEYFEMTATLRRSQKTVSAEKAKQEYLKFKKEYQIFQKYGEKLRALREEMYAELKEG